MGNLSRRLQRVEAIQTADPTHEASLAALERLENPPAGYTDDQKAQDRAVLRRWEAAAVAVGLG